MNTFDVYKLWPIEPVKGMNCRIWDREGREYLDLYGGHAVISIGHSHPVYVEAICRQIGDMGFYSNSVLNSLQVELSARLGRVSGYGEYSLFLSNSGAEANENALKLASFHTGREKVLAFRGAFHGRSSGAVAVTDNRGIVSPFNAKHEVVFVDMNDSDAARKELSGNRYAAVIIEGVQGVAGIYMPEERFLRELRQITTETGTILILDEIQSGYGRTGKFFAHQYAGIWPDIVTTAKGMGNGFPIGGTLISPIFKPVIGMLGTTFGGNHLACAAAIAVLDIIVSEKLVEKAAENGNYLLSKLNEMAGRYGREVIKDIRGRGLMVGIEMADEYIAIRERLLFEDRIFTGAAKSNIIRLLPPLTISIEEIDIFLKKLEKQIEKIGGA